ncbi:MAG: Rieske 2Fe-2S domain-containing protein [Actinomycetota bacterium]|nr:Rieske 2Fe-2S domain-containing protein [Actinomycetota bacterium]
MAAPNIPAAKRGGLSVDLDRLAADGDGWLSPEQRYALKTYGVCAQEQDHVFMVRVRIPGGVLPTDQARGLARLARAYSHDWLHLTTRQNVELHWVEDRKVPEVLDKLTKLGLSTRSACGHTMRNVMSSEEAGASLDEPFDCLPDARAVSDAILARSATLNCELPSRVNLAFGGSPRCRHDALLNDGGFVSVVRDGEAGYELWGGGSLGKAPQLAVKLADFVPRAEALAAAEALIDVFVAHGNFDAPAKGRLKYVVEQLGADAFRAAWEHAFAEARSRPHPEPAPVDVLGEVDRVQILKVVPPSGWSTGVRPQREVGRAYVSVDVPMGDLAGADFELLSDLADRHCDGALNLSRDQNVVLRNVPVGDVTRIRQVLVDRRLHLVGEAHVASVRACTGSAVCALGITTAPDAGVSLLESPALGRNSSLQVHVSGCPNSCAQHQAGDIGLAGSKVKVGGKTRDGYHVYLGADLDQQRLGEVVGRVAAEDVPTAVDAVVGAWESLRHGSETLGQAVNRIGHDAFAAHVETMMHERWATGPEEADAQATPTMNAEVTAPPSDPSGPWVEVAKVADVPAGRATTVEVDGHTLALVNVDGTFCAVQNQCPHAGGSLGEGKVDGWSLECPLHAATFDVRSGEVLGGPSDRPVRTYAVEVDGDTVKVAAGSYVEVARESDLPPGKAATVHAAGKAVALANVEGSFCAIQDACPHAGASLGEGSLDGWTLQCPLHDATFDVRSGEVLGGPAPADAAAYPVKVEDGAVKVGATEAVVLAGVDG